MDNSDEYAYGWNKSGQKFYSLKSGKRQGRVNMIAAFRKCRNEFDSLRDAIEHILKLAS